MNQKNCVIGPAPPSNSRISAEPTAGFILAHLKDPVFCLFSYSVAAKREKLIHALLLPLDISAAISTSDIAHQPRACSRFVWSVWFGPLASS